MKCKCVIFPLKEEKAEPRINQWLEENSNLNIKFVNQAIIDGRRKEFAIIMKNEIKLIFYYYNYIYKK